MGLEAPVGAAVHARAGKRGKAQLVLAGGNILGNFLQVLKALDVLDGIAGFLQQSLVGDDAVALDDVRDAVDGVAFFQRIVVAGELGVDVGAGRS